MEVPDASVKGRTFVVTGGSGFLGGYVVEKLRERGCDNIIALDSHCDLTDPFQTREMYRKYNPHVLIHLAAAVGGIGANRKFPGTYFYKNMLMGLNVIHQGMLFNVPKIVIAGTICAYPKNTPVPFREDDLWYGYPEETNAPYGIAKKSLLVMAQAYREQYKLNSVYLLPVNLYGPNDNFNPDSSHVIPALIKKIVRAKELGHEKIDIWGTGDPTREFLYVEDAAEAVVLATEKYNKPEPVNVGSGQEIKIRDLATKIAEIVGWEGEFWYETSMPDGQPRRRLDVTRARQEFSFEAKVSLDDGLRQTIQWYTENADQIP
jgi:GDP-L-fucose synthase